MKLETQFLLVDKVERALRQEIGRMGDVPGAKLEQESVLAARYGVSRQTLRQALERLKEEKLIRSARGSGTFIVPAARTDTEVVVFCHHRNDAHEQMAIRVLGEELKRRELTANLLVTSDPAADLAKLVRQRRGIRGGIIVGAYDRTTVQALASQSPIPLVMIGDMAETHQSRAVCDMVVADNMALAYQATDYLIRQGHRKVVFVGWHLEMIWNREMLRGYTEALRTHGIQADPAWTVDLPSELRGEVNEDSMRGPQQRIDAWFEGNDPPTAMVHAGSSESRMHDILHFNFHGRFPDSAVVPMMFFEMLESFYTGLRDSEAVAIRFEDLARRAVELLLHGRAADVPPVREMQARIYLCRRRQGKWGEEVMPE